MTMQRSGVLALLDGEGVPYELTEHPAVYTIGEMEALGLPFQAEVAKNLFLRDDKKRNYYLLTLREDKRADLRALRQKLEAAECRNLIGTVRGYGYKIGG